MRRIPALAPAMLMLSACSGMIPDAAEERHQRLRQSTMVFSPRPDSRQCLADLGAKQALFTPLPDQSYGAGCGRRNAVLLSGLESDDGALAVTNLGAVTCPLAETFAGWARFGADRAARLYLGSELVRIETMGSYNCRTVSGSDRLSAHATADAIDVSGFVLADGRRVTVGQGWSGGSFAERRFLRVVHASACKRFGTVLGPAYNESHANHFHVERSGKGFCR